MPLSAYTWSLYKPVIGINQIITPPRVGGFSWQWHGERTVKWYSEFDLGHDEMVRQAHALMSEADIICGWNSQSFDEPHLKAEFEKLDLPPVSPYQRIDGMRIARKTFRLPSYKLDYVAQWLGVGAKMKTGGFDLWIGCMNNDPAAWRKMGLYCSRDTRITTKVVQRLMAHSSANLGAYVDGDVCPSCMGTEYKPDGYARTGLGTFRKYQCSNPKCGRHFRSGKAVSRVDMRAAT